MSGAKIPPRVLAEQNSRTALTLSDPTSRGRKLPQYTAAILATLGALSAGTFMSWSSPAIPLLQDKLNHFVVTEAQGSWIGALMNLGAFLGAIPAGFAADRFGRKRTLFSMGFPLVAAWMLIAFSDTVGEIYAGRLLGGMGVGAVSVVAPMYIGELAEPHIRGALGAFFQLQITLGILLGYLAGMASTVKALSLICCAVPVVYLVLFVWMPESPVFLVATNRRDEATRALQWLRGPKYDLEDELTRMQDTMEESQRIQEPVLTLLRSKGVKRALVISLGLMTFQQLSGINAVIFYSGKIYANVGGRLPPNTAAIIIGLVQVFATAASTQLVDRAGRRVLLLASGGVMALCQGLLGLYFYMKEAEFDLVYFRWLPLVCLALFIIMFSIGFGPIPWIMLSELFPPEAKAAAAAISASCSWLLAFLVTLGFRRMGTTLGIDGAFWTFAIVCVFSVLFVAIKVPETKNKDLEDIQAELCGRRRQGEQEVMNRAMSSFPKPI
ncbi:facilitated trehalose transporter Tret1 [Anabrus simplex]|uniref:facilitated trehalose transporter Tret1 n=1 Tax=Anabrus simplex TaxID=316456 RepID=UPI0034DD2875